MTLARLGDPDGGDDASAAPTEAAVDSGSTDAETPNATEAVAEKPSGDEPAFSGSEGDADPAQSQADGDAGQSDEPSVEEQRQAAELKRRDREVRSHEQAHKAMGGQHTGAIQLEYELGPDGKRYAVAGSVPIDVSPVSGDPEATVRKMAVVRRAATAPANPSGADRRAAARAARVAEHARAQIAAERYERTQALLEDHGTRPASSEEASDGASRPAVPERDAPAIGKASPGPGSSLENHVLRREAGGLGRYQAIQARPTASFGASLGLIA
jgi:hypothetical protein